MEGFVPPLVCAEAEPRDARGVAEAPSVLSQETDTGYFMIDTHLMRLASFSLLLMVATSAAARASGAAVESHKRFDLSGPFVQSGYLTPPLTGTTSAPKETTSRERSTMVMSAWSRCGGPPTPRRSRIGGVHDSHDSRVHIDGVTQVVPSTASLVRSDSRGPRHSVPRLRCKLGFPAQLMNSSSCTVAP